MGWNGRMVCQMSIITNSLPCCTIGAGEIGFECLNEEVGKAGVIPGGEGTQAAPPHWRAMVDLR